MTPISLARIAARCADLRIDHKDGQVILRLPGIVGNRDVIVSVDDDEATVSFCEWHAHFDDVAEVVELIAAIAADRVVVLTAYTGDRWRGSTLNSVSDEAWLEFITEPRTGDRPDRFIQRSWSGAFDRRYP